MFTKRHDGIIRPISSEGCLSMPGSQGAPVPGSQGAPVAGAQGMHGQSARVIEWRDLTQKQQQVLEWLARWLKGEEKVITYLYRRIGMDLNIKQRAARVHVYALKEKGLILTTVAYRSHSKQKIGVCVSITPDAPIKHLPHKMSEAEILEIKESGRRNAQVWELLRKGYSFIPEINGYVREPQNMANKAT